MDGLQGLIKEGNCTTEEICRAEHAAEAIKDPRDIELMIDYFRARGQYRNLMYFTLAIYTGLRVSDMLRLTFSSLVNPDMTWRDEIVIEEKKTAGTRKRRVNRHIAINEEAKRAVREYLEHEAIFGRTITLDTYLFRSESRNSSGANTPIHRNKVDEFLKKAARETGVAERVRVSTHTTRKTFGYRVLSLTGDVTTLQRILQHSSPAITLAYCGITSADMEQIYLNLNYNNNARSQTHQTQPLSGGMM